MDHMHQHHGTERAENRWKWALIGFLVVAGYFLWTEHRAHLFGALAFLLVLACPLLHMFHHGGHGHGRHGGGGPPQLGDSKAKPDAREQS